VVTNGLVFTVECAELRAFLGLKWYSRWWQPDTYLPMVKERRNNFDTLDEAKARIAAFVETDKKLAGGVRQVWP
jgi:hypothetical protein